VAEINEGDALAADATQLLLIERKGKRMLVVKIQSGEPLSTSGGVDSAKSRAEFGSGVAFRRIEVQGFREFVMKFIG
jgi:hypothetical protein